MASVQGLYASLLILGVWAAGAAGQATSCEPVCSSECTPGQKVPNPRNCQQYYTCLEGCEPTDFVFDCPSGTLFDAPTAECVSESAGVTCSYCTPQCSFSCDSGVELAANPDDCGSAYLCSFDPPLPVSCEGLFFNGTACQEDETQCCDPCEVFCEVAYTQIMDPYDCHRYYYCSQVGYPLPGDLHECPNGEVFVGPHCDPDGVCNAPCGDGSGSTGATESTETTESTVPTVPAGLAEDFDLAW